MYNLLIQLRMEREPGKSPEEIQKIADKTQHSAIERKRSKNEHLLAEELAFLQRKEASQQLSKKSKVREAAKMTEYQERYPTLEIFQAAIYRAASSIPKVENAETAPKAEKEGLLTGLSNPALRQGVVVAVMTASLFSEGIAAAASKLVYQELVK